MPIFKCNTCQKTFSAKQRLLSHSKRIRPCIPPPVYNDKIAVSFVLQGISYETLINLIGNDKIISSQYINISNENAVIQPPLTINIVKQSVNNDLITEQIPNKPKETTVVETVETVELNNDLTTEQIPKETVELNNNSVNINETNKPEIKQCVRMKNIKLITPITSYIEFTTNKVIARCVKSKEIYKMPNGKVVERYKDTMKLQLQPLILDYFCAFRGDKRITKNSNKYVYNGVKISKNNLTNEMINVTKWILLDYRQKMDRTLYDDIDDLIAKLDNMTNSEIKMIFDIIDKRV